MNNNGWITRLKEQILEYLQFEFEDEYENYSEVEKALEEANQNLSDALIINIALEYTSDSFSVDDDNKEWIMSIYKDLS